MLQKSTKRPRSAVHVSKYWDRRSSIDVRLRRTPQSTAADTVGAGNITVALLNALSQIRVLLQLAETR